MYTCVYIFTSRREITFPFAYVFFHFSFIFLYSTILLYSHSLILHHSLPLSHSIPSQQHIACVPDLGLPRDHCVGTETVEDTRHLSTHIPQLGRKERGRERRRKEGERERREREEGEKKRMEKMA